MWRSLIVAATAVVVSVPVAAGAPPAPKLKPYAKWTYVQAMSITKGKTLTSAAHGELWLSTTGVFTDTRSIANFATSHRAGKFKFVGSTIVMSVIENGKRKPKDDAVYSYVYSKKYLALSIVQKLPDGSKLAYLLYLKGSENLPRCPGLGISLKC